MIGAVVRGRSGRWVMLKLGKLPARKGAVKLRFGAFFDPRKLPVPPLRFGHYDVGQPWGELANDQYGCCVWSGAAHETMVWTKEATGQAACFIDQNVLGDYAIVTGFDPASSATDQGTDMTAAASYRRKTGIADVNGVRHKIDAYVALRPGDIHDILLATYLTGGAGIGIRFPASAAAQFDAQEPWQVVPGALITGGHYVPCVGRNSNGDLLVVTWGRIHAMTPEFYAEYSDEALAYVSLEAMNAKGLTPEGFAADQLRADLAALAA